MNKKMATILISAGMFILSGGILMLGFTTKGIKPTHWIAIAAAVVVVGTLLREVSSSEKTDLIKAIGENTNNKVKELQIQNEGLLTQNTLPC